MFCFLRRNRAAALATVSFCDDSCSQVCTAACRTETRYDAARTQALATTFDLR